MKSLIILPFCFAAVLGGPFLAPLPYAAAPLAAVQYGVARTQHHSQDAYGNYQYGYSEPNGAKIETRHPDGTVTGSYSYPTSDGRILTRNYIADRHGFKDSSAPTALKDFAPKLESVYDVKAPVYATTYGAVAIPQAPLVATRSVEYAAPALVRSYGAPLVKSGYLQAPLAYGYGAPLGYNGLYY